MNVLLRLDDELFLAINRLARGTPWLHAFVLDYATYGVVLFAALLVTGVVVSRHAPTPRLAASGWAALATLLAVAANQPIGRLVHEARPYAAHPDVLRLADLTTDFSFPSDHAVMAGAVAAGLLLVNRRLGVVAAVAAAAMAVARVYIAAHYPWDVLAGLALGAGVALAGWALARPLLVLVTGWLRRTPLLRPIFGERRPSPATAPSAVTGLRQPAAPGDTRP